MLNFFSAQLLVKWKQNLSGKQIVKEKAWEWEEAAYLIYRGQGSVTVDSIHGPQRMS